MIWGYGIMGLILALLWWQNDSLQDELKEQHTINKMAINANERWEAEISKLNSEFAKGLETLSELKSKKEVERVYVKERSSNTNSCIDAINAVYERLWERENNRTTSNAKSSYTNEPISAK
ncbi:hypothetical protein [Campylobacter porcelli]|uniref:Uncharacterized protein n=1 Tax=Campylobacter porcelli TaxID=1660073 RepID=A0A1X9SVT3_9BACT|nr:hypothetical protein [Campylobacter sp. RM6137]ARR00388.1 hypothetical protein CSUIS_0561 [Campylobacter sp. RM6137]